jgi:phage terminase Nu1 subunit (DNA packaging protein)
VTNVVHIDFSRSEPLLTRRELSEALGHGYSVRTLEDLDKRGIPFEQRGRKRLYKETAVRNWMAREERKGADHAGQEVQGEALRRQATR